MKPLILSLVALAALGASASACDGYGQQILGFNSGYGCAQQFAFTQPVYAAQFAQPVYGYGVQQFGFAQPIYGYNNVSRFGFGASRLNINIGRNRGFGGGFRNNVVIRQRIRF